MSEPLDDLYDALAEVMGAEEETVCYKTYFLVSRYCGDSVSDRKAIKHEDSMRLLISRRHHSLYKRTPFTVPYSQTTHGH